MELPPLYTNSLQICFEHSKQSLCIATKIIKLLLWEDIIIRNYIPWHLKILKIRAESSLRLKELLEDSPIPIDYAVI